MVNEGKNTKQITCPEHGNHMATLYVFPHEFAGIWECDVEGISDTHEHSDYEAEEGCEDYYDPANYWGHGQREFTYYVCGGEEGCGVEIEDYVPDEPDYEDDCYE